MPATLIREKTPELEMFAYESVDELEDLLEVLGDEFDDIGQDGATVYFWIDPTHRFKEVLSIGQLLIREDGGWFTIYSKDEVEEDFEAVFVP